MRKKNSRERTNRTTLPAQEMAIHSDVHCPLVSHVLCKTCTAYMLLLFTNTTTVTIVEKENVNNISYAIKICVKFTQPLNSYCVCITG